MDEAEKPGESISTVSRRYKIAPSQMFGWRKTMEAGAATGNAAADLAVAPSRLLGHLFEFLILSVIAAQMRKPR